MIQLIEIQEQEDIQSSVLRHMLTYTPEDEVLHIFAVFQGEDEKALFVVRNQKAKDPDYYGSLYLYSKALPLYERAIREKGLS